MENVIVNVPSDERGQYVKKIAERAGVREFRQDTYGNIEFKIAPLQFEGMLDWSGLKTAKTYLNDYDCDIVHLQLGEIVYGQVWYNQSQLNEWNMKMAGAW